MLLWALLPPSPNPHTEKMILGGPHPLKKTFMEGNALPFRRASPRLLTIRSFLTLFRPARPWLSSFGAALSLLTGHEARELYRALVGFDADGKAAGLRVVEQLGLYVGGNGGIVEVFDSLFLGIGGTTGKRQRQQEANRTNKDVSGSAWSGIAVKPVPRFCPAGSSRRPSDCGWIRNSRTPRYSRQCDRRGSAPRPRRAPCPRRISGCRRRVR